MGLSQCLPHNWSLFINLAQLTSNLFVHCYVAALIYALWFKRKDFIIPLFMTAFTALVCATIKFTVGATHPSYPPETCCFGYIVTMSYSMPSGHASCATYLAGHLTYYYLGKKETLLDDPIAQKELYTRVAVLWAYVFVLFFCRVYLHLNGSWDVCVGVMIGVISLGCEQILSPIVVKKINFLKVD